MKGIGGGIKEFKISSKDNKREDEKKKKEKIEEKK